MGCRPVSGHEGTVLRGKDEDRLYGLFNTPQFLDRFLEDAVKSCAKVVQNLFTCTTFAQLLHKKVANQLATTPHAGLVEKFFSLSNILFFNPLGIPKGFFCAGPASLARNLQ